MITIESLKKYYASKLVLDDLNLKFEKARVYGIAGENGAGKTTLFKCITGIETYEGSIMSDFKVLKDHIGFLPTIPYFFERIRAHEYIRLFCNARQVEIDDMDRNNVFDLPLDEYAINYSTGMKKKLALTAILLQKNDLFILDEPYNGVDIQSNLIITEIIKKLKNMGKTILISSHIFSTLRDTCDEIHLLRKGKIHLSVDKPQFDVLEDQMKDFSIGNKVERLALD